LFEFYSRLVDLVVRSSEDCINGRCRIKITTLGAISSDA